MPANLTPPYKKAEQRFREAADDQERLACLQEMLQLVPKHKGTEKIQAEIKAKIAKIKKAPGLKSGGASKQKALDNIPREGAAQIPLVGPPNVGKSQFLASASNAHPLIADYPFTTREPVTGMMVWENVKFQLIDMPPIAPESYDGWMTSILFRADAVFLFADLSSDSLIDDLNSVLALLEEHRISLAAPDHEIDDEDYSLDEVVKKTFLVANKCDLDEDDIRLGFLREEFGSKLPIYRVNSISKEGISHLESDLFSTLQLLRVYTKTPGHEADQSDPVILHIGATVEDAAYSIHKDFAERLQFAKIWGIGKHDGQRVHNDFVLSDGDVLEFHI
ncbi:MAG: GTPase [Candidatus Zixiibacteriota bacterium]